MLFPVGFVFIELMYSLDGLLLASSTNISHDQIVHVKDENELPIDPEHKDSLMNMAEATEQMYHHQYPQPIILLERVSLENYSQSTC